ncbi:MAG: glycosyltransferase [Burkholderiaceae bacterium]|nr:glycosyltransferase [Burkholderiaceae bacterium]
MRILQLNFERGWRGGERQTLLSMQEFRAAGHEVALLARAGGDLASRAQADGFMVYPCSGIPAVGGTLLRYGRQFDVLHAQTANMMTWLALLKPFLRARIVFTRRTAFPVSHAREQQTRWKWRQADVVVAISQAAAAEPRRLGLEVVVIPSAVQYQPLDSEHLRDVARQLEVALDPLLDLSTDVPRQHQPGQRFVLATAAAMSSEKDPLTLIRAVHAVRQVRDDFVFLHLGSGGDIEYAARELVHDLGLEQHYIFAGFHRAIEDIYRLMDVFVLSSQSEALGTSVLDAFLYQVPVVSTDAGGLKESLAHGRGLLCAIGDYDALAAAILRLLDDSELRHSLVDKAYRYVRSEHDVNVMARRYLKAYVAA